MRVFVTNAEYLLIAWLFFICTELRNLFGYVGMKYSLCLKRAKPSSSWRRMEGFLEECCILEGGESKLQNRGRWRMELCMQRRLWLRGASAWQFTEHFLGAGRIWCPRTASGGDVAPGKPQSCSILGPFLLTSRISTVSLMAVSCVLTWEWLSLML